MKVIDPGHYFELDVLDAVDETTKAYLSFVKREGEGYPGNVGHHPGTNIQEVLRALISRVRYLDNQIHHPYNDGVLDHLRSSLWLRELRAAERHGRELQASTEDVEDRPTCPRCGHIGCDGSCHVCG